jgi:hypothetical protein
MKREIKFRVRYSQEYKGEITEITRNYTFEEIYLYAKPHKIEKILSIEQYTGLKDMNGKEIYEGDIFKFHDSEGDEDGAIGFVKWNDKYAWFSGLADIDSPNIKYEVIGNIHQNPELL